ncbi:hypothetical protein ACWEH3_32455 [Nocardia sp. NPDC004718]
MTGNIHAPTDRACTLPDSEGDEMPTFLGVLRPAGSGGKLFEIYPAPGETQPPPEGS